MLIAPEEDARPQSMWTKMMETILFSAAENTIGSKNRQQHRITSNKLGHYPSNRINSSQMQSQQQTNKKESN